MIDREDGPIKHYRMVCDSCGKKTKRFAYEFNFESDSPPGWREFGDEGDPRHQCPKCAGTAKPLVKEITPNVGEAADVSDHEEVYLPLTRRAANELVIDLGNGRTWTITSDSPIKVEQTEE